MRRLCSICARGGSKGIPDKNLRHLGGTPLVVHSVLHALESGLFNYVAVSSDRDEILTVCQKAGADILVARPPEMATDEAGKMPAIRHCLLEVERVTGIRFDVQADLSATGPLRRASDIAGAVRLLEARGAPSVITGCEARNSPYFNMVERLPDGSVALSKMPPRAVERRQDAPACFDMNGSIYVWWRDRVADDPKVLYPGTLLYEMPPERSLDIDTELDLRIAEFLWSSPDRPAGASLLKKDGS